MSRSPKAVVIGLDCAAPELVFDRWRDELPTLASLMARGSWGRMTSCVPAITVPAWASMMTGRDPGELGIYGFRNRADHSYEKLSIAFSGWLRERTVWDRLGQAGYKVVVMGVPPSWPPKPVNGVLVSCFLTPGPERPHAHPAAVQEEIRELVGEYPFDVKDFRTEDKDALLERIYDGTRRRFAVARRFLATKPWDFFMFVEMGIDRIHHAFWKYMDPAHPKHEPGNPFESAIRDFYRYVDGELGELLAGVPDEALLLVVSDHGAKAMEGGFRFNEWLLQEGYLHLRETPATATPLVPSMIDWDRTRAWGEGGYYGRLMLNVRDREPTGLVAPDGVDALLDELGEKLAAVPTHTGEPMGNRAFRPDRIYRRVANVPPDLLVYFGDLRWRSVGTVGGVDGVYTFENDTGPDDANHAQQGMFILCGNGGPAPEGELHIQEIAPRLLEHFGVAAGDLPRGARA